MTTDGKLSQAEIEAMRRRDAIHPFDAVLDLAQQDRRALLRHFDALAAPAPVLCARCRGTGTVARMPAFGVFVCDDGATLETETCPVCKVVAAPVDREALGDTGDAIASGAAALLESLGEYLRQTMAANPEWRKGVAIVEFALMERRKRFYQLGARSRDAEFANNNDVARDTIEAMGTEIDRLTKEIESWGEAAECSAPLTLAIHTDNLRKAIATARVEGEAAGREACCQRIAELGADLTHPIQLSERTAKALIEELQCQA